MYDGYTMLNYEINNVVLLIDPVHVLLEENTSRNQRLFSTFLKINNFSPAARLFFFNIKQ